MQGFTIRRWDSNHFTIMSADTIIQRTVLLYFIITRRGFTTRLSEKVPCMETPAEIGIQLKGTHHFGATKQVITISLQAVVPCSKMSAEVITQPMVIWRFLKIQRAV